MKYQSNYLTIDKLRIHFWKWERWSFLGINVEKSPYHHLSKNAHAQRFALDASNSIYKSALEETEKDLGEAIDSAVEAYTEKTIGKLILPIKQDVRNKRGFSFS